MIHTSGSLQIVETSFFEILLCLIFKKLICLETFTFMNLIKDENPLILYIFVANSFMTIGSTSILLTFNATKVHTSFSIFFFKFSNKFFFL